jgi:alkanesulfonate monooxygenase SsuD/methylene tetrahydromethanopterin reductase-like flavin-dependent oxidoreductase (luciferase family)
MARPLRVGVQLPEVEREVRWPEYLSIARAAEDAGFDSVWVGDHLLYRGDGRPERGPWDAWVLLSAIAAETERVHLGPLVACAAFHPPGILARMAHGVDEVSAGRFVFGIGAGWNEAEFRAFGLPFEHRAARFEESFGVIRRLLDGERVSLDGRFVRVDDAVLLPRPARRPPFMIGSTGERVLTAALPHVDAWNTWFDLYGNTPEGFVVECAKVDAIAERVGRPRAEIERSACVLVVLDRTTRERSIPDGCRALDGSADRIAGVLRDFAQAGANEAILVVDPITERSIRRLGEALAALDTCDA